jgi:hypothetical protein
MAARDQTPCVRGVFAPIEGIHSTRMVNAGFPERFSYGFEMVDAPDAWFIRKIAINRKFMVNPVNRIFRKFCAI